MHIDNTNMGLLASDSMVVDLMGGWFHGLRMKASNNGRDTVLQFPQNASLLDGLRIYKDGLMQCQK